MDKARVVKFTGVTRGPDQIDLMLEHLTRVLERNTPVYDRMLEVHRNWEFSGAITEGDAEFLCWAFKNFRSRRPIRAVSRG
jgi:hypothetical protein